MPYISINKRNTSKKNKKRIVNFKKEILILHKKKNEII